MSRHVGSIAGALSDNQDTCLNCIHQDIKAIDVENIIVVPRLECQLPVHAIRIQKDSARGSALWASLSKPVENDVGNRSMILSQVICDAIVWIAGHFPGCGTPVEDFLVDVIGITLANSGQAANVGWAHPLAIEVLCKEDLH